jgi:hypothetical protein
MLQALLHLPQALILVGQLALRDLHLLEDDVLPCL